MKETFGMKVMTARIKRDALAWLRQKEIIESIDEGY